MASDTSIRANRNENPGDNAALEALADKPTSGTLFGIPTVPPAVKNLMDDMGNIGPALQADLDRLDTAGIPVDVVFEQGMSVLR